MLTAAITQSAHIPTRLVFMTSSSFWSTLIRVFTKGPASHVALALGEHGEYLLHVHDYGVKLISRAEWFDTARSDKQLVAEYEILPDVSDGVRSVIQYIGDEFDHLEFFRIGIRRALGSPQTRHTCAQFIMRIDPESLMIPEWYSIDRRTVAPNDLLRVARTGPSFRMLYDTSDAIRWWPMINITL